MPLRGKAVIVTGGARGIGRYIALGAAERGADVAVCDIDEAAIETIADELAVFGTRTASLHVDVRDEEQVRDFIDAMATHLGRIDYLVNNAGIVPHFSWGSDRWPRVRDMDLSFWRRVMETNLYGTFLCSKYAIPYMERQGAGHIVNLHGGGPPTPPGAMAYVITKEAGVWFSRYLAEEEREHGICVMSLAPGVPIASEWAPEEARRRMPGPEAAGERFWLAIDAPMDLSGHLVGMVDGKLVAID